MEKRVIALAILLFAATLFCSIQIQTTTAQTDLSIHILHDGTISPATTSIIQNGSIYKLTANLNTSITIEKNSIIFDGQGFTIQRTGTPNSKAAVNLTSTGVTVKNCRIKDWQVGVLGAFDNNRITGNEFKNNTYDIAVYGKTYQITQNHLSYVRIQGANVHVYENDFQTRKYGSAFWITNSTGIIIEANNFDFDSQTTSFISCDDSSIKVFHNNFLGTLKSERGQMYFFVLTVPNTLHSVAPWDDGFPSGGNYWLDYGSKYQNVSMIDDSGIWNQTYQISGTAKAVDRYPLCKAYDITIGHLPTLPPTETPTATPAPTVPEFPVVTVLTILIIGALIMAGLKKSYGKTHGYCLRITSNTVCGGIMPSSQMMPCM
jgi:hypothetical protein